MLFPQPAGPVTTQICCTCAGFVGLSWVMDAGVDDPLRSGMIALLVEFTGACEGWGRSPAESMLKTGGSWAEFQGYDP